MCLYTIVNPRFTNCDRLLWIGHVVIFFYIEPVDARLLMLLLEVVALGKILVVVVVYSFVWKN